MNAITLLNSRNEIEASLKLPDIGWFTKNPCGFRLAYKQDEDEKFKYITVLGDEDGAAFLKRHGFIKGYKVAKEGVRMWTHAYDLRIQNLSFKMEPRQVPFMLSDLELTKPEALQIIAKELHRLTCSKIGILIEMFKNVKVA